jgi:hypothetical protein
MELRTFLELLKIKIDLKVRLATLALLGNGAGFAAAISIVKDSADHARLAATAANIFAIGLFLTCTSVVAVEDFSEIIFRKLLHLGKGKVDKATLNFFESRGSRWVIDIPLILSSLAFFGSIAYLLGYSNGFTSH